MPLVFRARSVVTASGTFGHLRIFTFSVQDPAAFVAEFVRLVEQLPQRAHPRRPRQRWREHLRQRVHPADHDAAPDHARAGAVQLHAAEPGDRPAAQGQPDPPDRPRAWFPSLDQSVETGAVYSSSFPISPEDGANSVGQRYFGPVVLVTDARCYSATDIFAAGFQDHGSARCSASTNTGAGGANVWTHGLLKALRDLPSDPETPYAVLPGGRHARGDPPDAAGGQARRYPGRGPRRVLRRPAHDDRPTCWRTTSTCSTRPAPCWPRPVRRVGRHLARRRPHGDPDLQVAGVDRVDVYVDGRPQSTSDVTGGPVRTVVGRRRGWLRIDGFAAVTLVAIRSSRWADPLRWDCARRPRGYAGGHPRTLIVHISTLSTSRRAATPCQGTQIAMLAQWSSILQAGRLGVAAAMDLVLPRTVSRLRRTGPLVRRVRRDARGRPRRVRMPERPGGALRRCRRSGR